MTRWRAPWIIATVALVLAGCTNSVPAPESAAPSRILQPAFAGSPVLPPPNLTDDGPGSLVESKPLAKAEFFEGISATAVRIVYRSTTGTNGAPSEVSGVVAVPPGPPPSGGWPIMVLGHDVTGLANKCAPSLAPDLAGYASFMGVMLSRGYVVVMTDYQGLGIDGKPPHSLIDAVTLGNNVIDAARAVRRVTDTVGIRWSAFGYGEGGTAAWAATERAGTYGGGLDLVGAAALAPLADLSALATEAEAGTLTPEQYKLQMLTVENLALTSTVNRDDFRSGLAKDQWDLLIDCAPPDPSLVPPLYAQLRPSDLQPSSPAAAEQLRTALSSSALPVASGAPPVAPLLVIYATEDPAVPRTFVNGALRRACVAGAPIEIVTKVGDTQTTTDLTVQYALDWLQNRFGGATLSSVCQGVT